MMVLNPRILTDSDLHKFVVTTMLSTLSCNVFTGSLSIMSQVINSKHLDDVNAVFRYSKKVSLIKSFGIEELGFYVKVPVLCVSCL